MFDSNATVFFRNIILSLMPSKLSGMYKNILNEVVLLLCTLLISSMCFSQSKEKPYQDQIVKVEERLREGDFQGGIRILDVLGENYPEADDVFYAKALIYGQVGNLAYALENVKKAYAISPSLLYYNYILDIYRTTKDWDRAVELMRDARERFVGENAISRDLIATLGYIKEVDGALSIYNEERKAGVSSDTLDVVMADVYFFANRINEGMDLLLPWYENSSLSSVYGKLAFGYLESNRIKKAISTLQKGLDLTKDPILYLDLADAYALDGRKQLSFDALKSAFVSDSVEFVQKYRVMLDLLGMNNESFSLDQVQQLANTLALKHPRLAESHMLKGEILWKRGNYSEARSMFLTAVGIAPMQVDAWRMLINVDLVAKDSESAVKHALEALTINQGNPVLMYFAGLAYMANEDNNEARKLLEMALDNSTGENAYLQSIIYGTLGDLYHKLNLYDISDVAYEEAIKLDSMNVTAMNNFAYYLSIRKKDLDKAALYSLRSNELEPNSPIFQDTYAWVLFQQGNYGEALKWIEKAVKVPEEQSAVSLEHYGDILSMLGRTKDAVKQWKRALDFKDLKSDDKNKIEQKIKEKRYVE